MLQHHFRHDSSTCLSITSVSRSLKIMSVAVRLKHLLLKIPWNRNQHLFWRRLLKQAIHPFTTIFYIFTCTNYYNYIYRKKMIWTWWHCWHWILNFVMLDGLHLDHTNSTLVHVCGTQTSRNKCSLHVPRCTTVCFYFLLLLMVENSWTDYNDEVNNMFIEGIPSDVRTLRWIAQNGIA